MPGPNRLRGLSTKGVLALPEPSLQHALLLAYTKFVHTLLPVLELHDFFSSLHLPRCGRGNMSIFLYKAVLFAASSFVDECRFSQSVLFSREEVSRKLFHDVRLLYEFGSETDTVVLIQGLLLMTLRLDPEDGPKDVSHWNGIALSLIEKLLRPMGMSPEPPSACCGHSLWKRLWYCCYTRDQHIAMSLHPPLSS
ncbi:Cutinase transcription factor 1 beta [Fusarium agapanthi]|uniref:Cutinase transcription factor 1 beta n=1 Tax=Fusarium agapanthi TaxID=1803897 RepID=A0A9P5B8F3_9HYPO|nr:Cutinase transcription factor 1 beta [Fusarium agapanthi]